jgi:hypothetical protein
LAWKRKEEAFSSKVAQTGTNGQPPPAARKLGGFLKLDSLPERGGEGR